jgi:DAACS family dicarboxylate/amino acid:cation (Na+ or H+) symporter
MDTTKGRIPLHTKIFIGLILGAVIGFALQFSGNAGNDSVKFIADNITKPVGNIFLNMIFMIVVPLLFSALILGVSEIGEARKFGKIGMYCLAMTVLLSGIAVAIGLTAVNIVKPGAGVTLEERETIIAQYGSTADTEKNVAKAAETKTFGETIVEIVPKSPIDSASKALEGGILAFMFFALIFGVALSSIEAEKALPVKAFFEGVFAVSLKVIEFAMKLAPYGVFGLTFTAALVLKTSALTALGKYVVLVLVVLAFHQFVVYSLALKFIAKRNPVQFFRQIRRVMVTAFATSSSNATLPVALQVAEEEVGLPRNISNFVLTIGATANQNGTALFEGVTILFMAQFFGIDLSIGQQATVMGLAILAGVGTAGVPGGAWPMIASILKSIAVPAQGIGVIIGFDRILDMSRTVLNVTGDITIAACVAQLAGMDDEHLALAES